MGKLYIKPSVLRGVMLSGGLIGGNTGIGIGDLDDEEEEDAFARMLSVDSQESFVPVAEAADGVSIPLESDPVANIEIVPELPTVLPELTEDTIDLS